METLVATWGTIPVGEKTFRELGLGFGMFHSPSDALVVKIATAL